MNRSNRRLRLHQKSTKQQLKAAKRKAKSLLNTPQRVFITVNNGVLRAFALKKDQIRWHKHDISWVKAQQKLNKKNRYGSPLNFVSRY